MGQRQRMRMFGLGAVIITAAALGGLTACEPQPTTYVALGDSYTAGPLIPDQSTEPLGCLRSNHDWPAMTRPNIHVTAFKDVSCSGADSNDLANAQGVDPGPNPPQLDSVDIDTKVVTLQIGGNDIGFSDIVKTCALQLPWGSGCTGDYVHDGRDELSEKINALGPKLDTAISQIKQRGARAKIFLVGYPAVIPASGSGCYPLVPVLGKDIPYLRNKVVELNAKIAERAQAAGVTYIDIYTPSIGHDFCASTSNKWVEGIIPTSVAAPVHPNAKGMANFATTVAAAINAEVPS